jgi:hypothetical protein
MNAVTRTGGEEHFMEVQNQVIGDELQKENITEENTYAFILDNAPIFRFFATHLPDELGGLWDAASTDERARIMLGEEYKNLRGALKNVFEQQFDADTQTALTDAAESGDIATAERILEAHIALAGRSEE